ncbi:transposase [Plakobranchus ocellatus]|uniref:Transposase n=1 Tax=Plakobranchus ocellatus TaxID=259542 RepID=A0AAV4CDQ3_9GAST|nr:transposase [Plakobranchus ocellatus]
MATSKDLLIKQRSVIEFLAAEGYSAANIHTRMKTVYGEMCISDCAVRKWVRMFKGEDPRETILRDRKRSGRPLSASVTAHREEVDCMIRANRRVNSRHFERTSAPYRHNCTGLPKSLCPLCPKTAHCRDESAEKGHVYSTLRAFNCLHFCMNICSRTSLGCQKLDNRALFDEKVIGRHCLINMATPSRVARHCIMSTNDVTQTCCSREKSMTQANKETKSSARTVFIDITILFDNYNYSQNPLPDSTDRENSDDDYSDDDGDDNNDAIVPGRDEQPGQNETSPQTLNDTPNQRAHKSDTKQKSSHLSSPADGTESKETSIAPGLDRAPTEASTQEKPSDISTLEY